MSGKDVRLGRLFSNGRPVIIAADHGSYMGPFEGIEDLPERITQFKKADAFLVMPGMAKRCRNFFSQKDSPLCIIRVNWASHYCKPFKYEKGYNVKLSSVEYAVSQGADIVIASLLLGTDEEANVQNISEFGQFIEDSEKLGIPVIGEYIPIGGIDRYKGDTSKLTLGTRAIAEFGADLIKTVYVEDFEKVTGSSPIPVLALGGGKTDNNAEAFAIASNAIKKGAAGVVFGRNCICAENPSAYLECLIDVVKNDMTPEVAAKKYDGIK